MEDIGLKIFQLDDEQRNIERQLPLIVDQKLRDSMLRKIANLKAQKFILSEWL